VEADDSYATYDVNRANFPLYNLSYSSYCFGSVHIPRYGTFILSAWRYYCAQNFVTYILNNNINEEHHIYVQIKSSDILQC
jgi:hypothetical protein